MCGLVRRPGARSSRLAEFIARPLQSWRWESRLEVWAGGAWCGQGSVARRTLLPGDGSEEPCWERGGSLGHLSQVSGDRWKSGFWGVQSDEWGVGP